jgi:hypothetical protein
MASGATGKRMSDFGDYVNDDAFDTEPPDAYQVAKKIHRLRREYHRESVEWESLSDEERQLLVNIAMRLIHWLRRQGAIVG